MPYSPSQMIPDMLDLRQFWASAKPRKGSDRVLQAIAPNTIIPVVEAVRHCKVKAGLRHSPQGLHTRTRLSSLRLNLDSSLKMTWYHSAAD
ncbi:hypothetical protein TNCV_3773481 [Trichonephila clavipes]|nr:hypothetical protein TNCV_3773481 [Trichonephila clavipes]